MFSPYHFVSAILLMLAIAPLSAFAAGEVTTPSGLRIIDVKPGTGPMPAGQTVTVSAGMAVRRRQEGQEIRQLGRPGVSRFRSRSARARSSRARDRRRHHACGRPAHTDHSSDLGYGARGAGGVIHRTPR